MDNRRTATTFGSGALLLWAAEPVLVSEMTGMPIFEALSIIFISCFVPNAIRLSVTNKWSIVKGQSWFVWMVGVSCICGSDLAYILGAGCAPIAHVDLIDYMWPCMVVLFIGMLPNEKLKIQHIIGVLLGMLGIFILITNGEGIDGIKSSYVLGYALAFYGAVLWGVYSAFSRYHISIPCDMVGMYCGVGAILCIIAHISLETFIIPSSTQLTVAVLTGLTGPGLAYQLWDYGIKYGNAKLLSSMTYFTRILGMVLLVCFDKEPMTKALIIACIVASLGVFITSIDKSSIKKMKLFFTSKVIFKLRTSQKNIFLRDAI